MNTYRIHEANIERLHSKVNRIRNKCAKYGCDFHYAEVGEEFVPRIDDDDNEVIDKYILVECEGTAQVNGWEFAGTIDFLDGGNVVRKAIDVDIPARFNTCECECEHCHSRRHRKNTYIVYNSTTGEFKQVGSSCVSDFTGGLSAEQIASYISLFDEMIEGESIPSSGWSKRYYPLDDILAYAVDYVSNEGYLSSQYDSYHNTKSSVLVAYEYDNGCRYLTPGDKEEVEAYRAKFHPDYSSKEIIDQVAEIKSYVNSMEGDTDYARNLKVLANTQYIEYKQFGYVCSMVPVYNRHIEDIARAKRQAQEHEAELGSQFQGQVGDRIRIELPDWSVITSWDSQFGHTTRYKLTDKAGNVYMWDSSTYIDTDRPLLAIVGTVKKHDTFRDINQTWLTRCKCEYGRRPTKEDIKSAEAAGQSVTEYIAEVMNLMEAV